MAILDNPASGSIEINPNFTAVLYEKGELFGIKILNVSTFIWDLIQESVQA